MEDLKLNNPSRQNEAATEKTSRIKRESEVWADYRRETPPELPEDKARREAQELSEIGRIYCQFQCSHDYSVLQPVAVDKIATNPSPHMKILSFCPRCCTTSREQSPCWLLMYRTVGGAVVQVQPVKEKPESILKADAAIGSVDWHRPTIPAVPSAESLPPIETLTEEAANILNARNRDGRVLHK